ncbi:unnamed protein product [Calicophoron daubneyi]|uniref:Snake toxin/toxin-like domain-containing protein n=1 Tax=Calicophoron daubneyi TaxID=300641 RepID=A0AAV2TXJ7_CALDB
MLSVTFQYLYIVILCYIIALPASKGLKCYECVECQNENANRTESSNCTYCETKRKYEDYELKSLTFTCASDCSQPLDLNNGTGEAVECCTQDLCNSANGEKFMMAKILLATAFFTILM